MNLTDCVRSVWRVFTYPVSIANRGDRFSWSYSLPIRIVAAEKRMLSGFQFILEDATPFPPMST
jgi:hypothetical protein